MWALEKLETQSRECLASCNKLGPESNLIPTCAFLPALQHSQNQQINSAPMTTTAMPDANMGAMPLGASAGAPLMMVSSVDGQSSAAQNLPGGPEPASSQGPKSHPCDTCGKAFARRSDLSRHGILFTLPFFSLSSPFFTSQQARLTSGNRTYSHRGSTAHL